MCHAEPVWTDLVWYDFWGLTPTPLSGTYCTMLTHLRIKDFALIEELDLELFGGLNVLTGETGAGKSILVDAIGLVLGDRADAAVVRHGRERAEIGVEFDLSDDPDTRAWLVEEELDDEEQCLLRRTINRQGRSRAYVNGHKVPVAQLKRLGERLMDIHGQHEHQSLLRPKTQLGLVDQYGDHQKALDTANQAFQRWQDCKSTLKELEEDAGGGDAGVDFLRHQVRELQALELGETELQELESEHERLRHGGRLLEEGQAALALAYEGDGASASELLSQAQAKLESLVSLDQRLEPIRAGLEQAGIHLDEAAESLQRYLSDLDLDPPACSGSQIGSVRPTNWPASTGLSQPKSLRPWPAWRPAWMPWSMRANAWLRPDKPWKPPRPTGGKPPRPSRPSGRKPPSACRNASARSCRAWGWKAAS